MSKLTYQEFKEMEEKHSEGNLINICKECGNPYKSELKTYNKKTWKLKKTPIVKLQKNGKIKVDKYEKEKKVVGNFMCSTCNNCLIELGKIRRKYREEIRQESLKFSKRTKNEQGGEHGK